MLQLGAKLGFFPLIFVRRHFQEIGIAALLLGLKPRHVEKIPRMSVDGRRRK